MSVGQPDVADFNAIALTSILLTAKKPGTTQLIIWDDQERSQIMDVKGERMVRRDFAPEGRARQTLKDVDLMLEQGRAVGQELPLLSVHADVLRACLRHDEGDLDNSVVIEELRRRRTG